MIDDDGFRQGVGIILVNEKRQIFLAKRIGKIAWQFPQGGIKADESPIDAMYRELKEEIGLVASDVKVLSSTRRWLRYRLPKRLVRHYSKPICIGQKQKW
ncbi:MAG TPA: RNA pyrophosphohydrolase, partial [Gammaproteobacteria bacterium]|nr:RNA pyrophosphohydrolase [Gammaproteobacteria bacterium]